VVLKSTVPITTGSGAMKSTNYRPVFEIVGWAPRPADLVWSPKNAEEAATVVPFSGQQAAPPVTGARQVAAPATGGEFG
jgi:hypothetical protein